MKAARLSAPLHIAIVDLPSPPLGPGQVRVRIASVGVCGSDMGIIRGANPFASYPLVPGHEMSGTVAEVAPGSRFSPGQRVYVRPILTCMECVACRLGEYNHCPHLKVVGVHCDGAYAQEVVLPEYTVRALPDGMSFDDGAMIEPVAVAVHSVNRGEIQPGAKVAVLGAGVIGNLIFQVAKARGAGAVLVTDEIETRLVLARDMGADVAVNVREGDPVKVGLEALGPFDVVFDLVGIPQVMNQAIQLARAGGTIVLLVPPHAPQLEIGDYTSVFRKEMTLRVSRLYDKDFDEAAPLILSGKVKVRPLITHTFALDQVREAIDTVQNRTGDAIKALLHC